MRGTIGVAVVYSDLRSVRRIAARAMRGKSWHPAMVPQFQGNASELRGAPLLALAEHRPPASKVE